MQEENGMLKAYDHSTVENRIYAAWEASGAFSPETLPERNQQGEPYAIVMPPPNRTGTLHLGHAVMLAVEDLLIRFHRMKGKKTIWIPGTDHAAIATQVKVEKLLLEQEGKTRHDLGREKFLRKVVAFAEESKNIILSQVRRMGSSCDWSRESYTLDALRNRAVNEMFRRMAEDGIVERGHRVVNWDPVLQTTISDDEIEWIGEMVPLYTFQYGPFQITTARPETKFGDKYVVMHPDDERYRSFKHGEVFEAEWINGPVKAMVIKDTAIDPSFGTGVMTITPWHDAVDFEIAERHGLDREQIIDRFGKLLSIAGEFAGMDIEEARPKIVEKLRYKGLLVKTDETYLHRRAVNSRGGKTIEPQIMRQWFVRVNKKFVLRQDTLGKWKKSEQATLKELMTFAVTSGQIRILPERFKKIYFHWVDHLRDWCISRQIWFGHRVPVWERKRAVEAGSEMMISDTKPEGEGWEQDLDTLDTWFSSGLWTFSTLGWPDEEMWSKQRMFHPVAVLETGYDILFFWVARMILMSVYAIGEVPFRDVYLHGLVRDEQGRKMSKSLGNILDPLDLIPKYGTDAVRLSLLIGSAPGQDMRLSEAKVEGFRNFANKLWNISRFILSQQQAEEQISEETIADAWIMRRLSKTIESVTKKLDQYQFSLAGEELRDFTWGDLADWYLEIAKIETGKQAQLRQILQTLLQLWHPFMPFVTEEIWQRAAFDGQLILSSWPDMSFASDVRAKEFEKIKSLITDIRRLKSENHAKSSSRPKAMVVWRDSNNPCLFEENLALIERLAKISSLKMVSDSKNFPHGWCVGGQGWQLALHITHAINEEEEERKIEKELLNVEAFIALTQKKLSNSEFTSKAPPKIVEEVKQKLSIALEKKNELGKRFAA